MSHTHVSVFLFPFSCRFRKTCGSCPRAQLWEFRLAIPHCTSEFAITEWEHIAGPNLKEPPFRILNIPELHVFFLPVRNRLHPLLPSLASRLATKIQIQPWEKAGRSHASGSTTQGQRGFVHKGRIWALELPRWFSR